MNIKKSSILLVLLTIFSVASFSKKNNLKVENHLDNILSNYDTVFYLTRGGSVSDDRTAYVLYFKNGEVKFEYYYWLNSTGEILYKFKSRKKTRVAYALLRFALNNYDSLVKFNGRDVCLEEIINEKKKEYYEQHPNDSSKTEVVSFYGIDHYAYIDYRFKCGDKELESKLIDSHPTASCFLNRAPLLAYFICALMNVHYLYNFDQMIDQPLPLLNNITKP